MVLDTLSNAERYCALHPKFQELFDYVRTHALLDEPAGRIELDGQRLFINVNDSELLAPDLQKLEVHRRYIDVHFPLSCDETVGWTPLDNLQQSDEPFDEAADYALYSQPADTYFTVKPGQFLIVWPEDAHAPIVGCGNIRKLVAKVLI